MSNEESNHYVSMLLSLYINKVIIKTEFRNALKGVPTYKNVIINSKKGH
jgi:hypothetical protein